MSLVVFTDTTKFLLMLYVGCCSKALLMCRHYQGSLDVFILLQTGPEQTKKQQEGDDSTMKGNHQDKAGRAALQVAEQQGRAQIATLKRNKEERGADRMMKDTLLQASPEEIKKQEEDADRAMKELLEEEDTAADAPAAVSYKKDSDRHVSAYPN